MFLNTEKILNILTKDMFPEEVHDIFELLFEHRNRVRFVKESDGVQNLLGLSTKAAADKLQSSETAHFSIFLKKEKGSPNSKQIHQYLPEEIFSTAKKFLTSTNFILYVQIFFEGSIVNNDKNFEMYYILDEEKCTIGEAFAKVQELPPFYEELATTSNQIKKELKTFQELRIKEERFLDNLIYQTILEFEDALLKSNFDKAEQIRKEITMMQNQLEDIHKQPILVNRK